MKTLVSGGLTILLGVALCAQSPELREGTFEFLDKYKNTITGRQRLFPAGTVLAGKRIPRA